MGIIINTGSRHRYSYNSISFGSARKVINYLDKYHLLSSKHVNFLKWRKVYHLVQEDKYLIPRVQSRIIKIKLSMDNYSRKQKKI